MKTIRLTHDYDAPAADLWALAIDLDALQEVMRGLIAFDGLPSGRVHTGQSCSVMVSLFGRLPAQPYHMDVLECNDDAMILRSSEHGAGVKSWHHTLSVQDTPSGSRLIDVIEIDAGWLTWLFATWAKFLYSKRHAPRVRMLQEKSKQA
jgi:hypothetical protein